MALFKNSRLLIPMLFLSLNYALPVGLAKFALLCMQNQIHRKPNTSRKYYIGNKVGRLVEDSGKLSYIIFYESARRGGGGGGGGPSRLSLILQSNCREKHDNNTII